MEKYIKTIKVKQINVYMSNDTKGKLLDLSEKYHVSMSTICDKACRLLYKCDLMTKVKNDKQATYRTKLKVKYFMEYPLESPNEETIYATNSIYFAVNHFENFIENLTKEKKNQMYNKFLSELSKCRDIYWDYNSNYRQQVRARKQYEKDYGKKE